MNIDNFEINLEISTNELKSLLSLKNALQQNNTISITNEEKKYVIDILDKIKEMIESRIIDLQFLTSGFENIIRENEFSNKEKYINGKNNKGER